jgi:hypothetical protein
MSQVDRPATNKDVDVDEADRAWLERWLQKYRDLLAYLRDH